MPLDRSIRVNGDRGLPSVVAESDGEIAQSYQKIARAVITSLEATDNTAGPEIVFQ
ncbi:MAG: ATP-binding protein involved in chromosome partitioning [Patiriisocius sp.]